MCFVIDLQSSPYASTGTRYVPASDRLGDARRAPGERRQQTSTPYRVFSPDSELNIEIEEPVLDAYAANRDHEVITLPSATRTSW